MRYDIDAAERWARPAGPLGPLAPLLLMEPEPEREPGSQSVAPPLLLGLGHELLLLVLGNLGGRDLGRLRCAAKAFTRSLTEEAAQLLMLQRGHSSAAQPTGSGGWARWLGETEMFEGPPVFTRASKYIEVGGMAATKKDGPGEYATAVLGGGGMRRGIHTARFTIHHCAGDDGRHRLTADGTAAPRGGGGGHGGRQSRRAARAAQAVAAAQKPFGFLRVGCVRDDYDPTGAAIMGEAATGYGWMAGNGCFISNFRPAKWKGQQTFGAGDTGA